MIALPFQVKNQFGLAASKGGSATPQVRVVPLTFSLFAFIRNASFPAQTAPLSNLTIK
jgi:hypothetical protein